MNQIEFLGLGCTQIPFLAPLTIHVQDKSATKTTASSKKIRGNGTVKLFYNTKGFGFACNGTGIDDLLEKKKASAILKKNAEARAKREAGSIAIAKCKEREKQRTENERIAAKGIRQAQSDKI